MSTACSPLAAPGVVGGNAGDVPVGQLVVGAVHHAAELLGVNEEYVAAAVAKLAVLVVASERLVADGGARV